jgi:hypothetical protein
VALKRKNVKAVDTATAIKKNQKFALKPLEDGFGADS